MIRASELTYNEYKTVNNRLQPYAIVIEHFGNNTYNTFAASIQLRT